MTYPIFIGLLDFSLGSVDPTPNHCAVCSEWMSSGRSIEIVVGCPPRAPTLEP